MKTELKPTPVSEQINIGIKASDREQVIKILRQLLADQHVFYIKLRNYHWNVEGIHFQQLHAFFAEQYTVLDAQIDDIAERIRSLGDYAPGSMAAFRELSRLQESDGLQGNATQMLQNILADHELTIQVLRHDVEATMDEYHDAGTSDFLTALMEAHEKMAWMVRAHLR